MNLTASGTDLALHCAYLYRPDIHVARTESAAGAAGTEEHGHIEGTIAGEDEDAPTSETHARWIAEWWESERDAGWQAEVAIALHPHTGETMLVPRAHDGHRDYSAVPAGFIPGTADGVAWAAAERHLRIADWKTGQADAYRARTLVRGADGRMVARTVGWRRPSDLGQLLTLGEAFARHYGAAKVTLELVPANETRLHRVAEDVSRLDLRLHRDRLADVVDGLPTAEAHAGSWCRTHYCPLLGHCPATRGALGQAAPAVALSRYAFATHSGEFTGPEHVGAQWAMIEAAEARLAAGKLAARMWLKERGAARLPDGSTLAMEPQRRERIDIAAPGALDALKRAMPDAWESVVETRTVVSASKGRIYDAVKPAVVAAKAAAKAAGQPVRGLTYEAAAEAVVAALSAVDGAVKVSEFEVPKVVPAAPLPVAGAATIVDDSEPSMCSWCSRVHRGGPERCGSLLPSVAEGEAA